MRQAQSYGAERSKLQNYTTLLPRFETEFAETKALLLDTMSEQGRGDWQSGIQQDGLIRTFEDLLTAGGVTTYSDGSNAFLGAYMSLYDFIAAKVVCSAFTEGELRSLQRYYTRQTYLSPIFSLVAGSCRDELARREKAELAMATGAVPASSVTAVANLFAH